VPSTLVDVAGETVARVVSVVVVVVGVSLVTLTQVDDPLYP